MKTPFLLLALCWFPLYAHADDTAGTNGQTASPSSETNPTKGFSITETEHGVTIKVGDRPFVDYVIDDINKPYLWPIIGPTGKEMTRAYPMAEVANESAEQRDHPHHRGVTFGHHRIESAESPGADSWHEWITFGGSRKGPGQASIDDPRLAGISKILHRSFTTLEAHFDHAVVTEICDHVDPNGKLLLTEQRKMTFRVKSNSRCIDFDQVFTAAQQEVCLQDRKDAGLSIRVPASMAVDNDEGGTIVNSDGAVDSEAWSRAAKWCDYNGPVDGEHLGIAFLSHPSSFRFPTRWHVRDYGLFTANPFGSKAYDSKLPDGTTTLQRGESLQLHHRIVFHVGDPARAGIEEAWQDYAKIKK